MLKIFTARSDESLIGYFVVICRPHLHYMDHMFAFNDVLYLDKDYRKGLTGPKLMKFAEKCLKEDGVSVLIVNTKRHKPFDSLLEWLGYKHTENVGGLTWLFLLLWLLLLLGLLRYQAPSC